MDVIIDYARIIFEDPAVSQFLVVGVIALAVGALGFGVASFVFESKDPIRRRLGDIAVDEPRPERRRVDIQTVLGPVSQWVLPTEDIERDKTTTKLVHAGFRGPNALSYYYASKLVFAILLPLVVVVVCQLFPKLTSSQITLYAIIAAGIGVLGPNMVLERLVMRRMKQLRVAFPDALDLLVVCVEAGLGLGQAIERVSKELGVSHPDLATEMAVVNAEMRAGVDNIVALRNLASRTGLDDIRGLVGLLAQTIRFGTSIAESLRVYSEEFRDKRMQAAEEQAAKIGTKMIFPLVLFMFPGFFVVAVGPAVISLMKTFGGL